MDGSIKPITSTGLNVVDADAGSVLPPRTTRGRRARRRGAFAPLPVARVEAGADAGSSAAPRGRPPRAQNPARTDRARARGSGQGYAAAVRPQKRTVPRRIQARWRACRRRGAVRRPGRRVRGGGGGGGARAAAAAVAQRAWRVRCPRVCELAQNDVAVCRRRLPIAACFATTVISFNFASLATRAHFCGPRVAHGAD